jgi:hypothetical protein
MALGRTRGGAGALPRRGGTDLEAGRWRARLLAVSEGHWCRCGDRAVSRAGEWAVQALSVFQLPGWLGGWPARGGKSSCEIPEPGRNCVDSGWMGSLGSLW